MKTASLIFFTLALSMGLATGCAADSAEKKQLANLQLEQVLLNHRLQLQETELEALRAQVQAETVGNTIAQKQTVTTPRKSNIQHIATNAKSVSPVSAQKTTPSTKPEQRAYQQALQTYENYKYAQAITLFDSFMQQYPQSKLMPNALYWKGESLYALGNYADALFMFKEVTTRFPKSAKAPDALLKSALSYKRLGDTANAHLHTQILGEDFPNSTAFKLSKNLGLGN